MTCRDYLNAYNVLSTIPYKERPRHPMSHEFYKQVDKGFYTDCLSVFDYCMARALEELNKGNVQ